ncbi:hypothetical protein Btru_062541 [Bulinus truncatus]|nr:hypothetical protein Btru_062541 [Bulinus truncatus]
MPFLNHQVDSDGEILHHDSFAWNKFNNMIYLEAPAGVGFSYSEDKNYTTDDNEGFVKLEIHYLISDMNDNSMIYFAYYHGFPLVAQV